jgi:hypothetical protein
LKTLFVIERTSLPHTSSVQEQVLSKCKHSVNVSFDRPRLPQIAFCLGEFTFQERASHQIQHGSRFVDTPWPQAISAFDSSVPKGIRLLLVV